MLAKLRVSEMGPRFRGGDGKLIEAPASLTGFRVPITTAALEDGNRPMTDTLTKTAAANAPINDTRKAELLSKTVKHIDITSFDARPIVDAMADMSFTSRDLGRATKIYNQMLGDKDCTVVLVIAGSTARRGPISPPCSRGCTAVMPGALVGMRIMPSDR
jgi:hypothetical protein